MKKILESSLIFIDIVAWALAIYFVVLYLTEL